MSQVKNLRAMFENKGDDPNPPDRGRSPAGFSSHRGSNASESPRPLSTVRTNFVAIEKHGRIGLRRDHSFETSPSGRAASNEADNESATSAPTEDVGRANRKLFLKEAIPESPQSLSIDAKVMVLDKKDGDAVASQATSGTRKAANWVSSTPVDSGDEATTSQRHGQSAKESALTSGEAPPSEERPVAQEQTQPARTADKTQKGPKVAANSGAKPPPRASRPAAEKQPVTAPGRAQSRTSVAAPSHAKTASSSGAKAVSSSGTQKPAPIRINKVSESGFVKPKPKSPTKPLNLPSSLMAPTASSVSKGAAASSKRSGGLDPGTTSGRPASRVSANGPGGGRTIRKQPSSIHGLRPSVGPPPKQPSSNAATAHREKQVDEGFLARMMRPTQSSSSKTNEKAPPTPPRRSGQRQVQSSTTNSPRRSNGIKKTSVTTATARSPSLSSSKRPSLDPAVEAESSSVEVLPGASEVTSGMKDNDSSSQAGLEERAPSENEASGSEQQIPALKSDEQLDAVESSAGPQKADEKVRTPSPEAPLTEGVLPDQSEQVRYADADDTAVSVQPDGSAASVRLPQQQEDTASSDETEVSIQALEEGEVSNIPSAIRPESQAGDGANESATPSFLPTADQPSSQTMAENHPVLEE
ncbi:uncharacterized protein F5Z01DRAFT_651253 [Emericellopsis atlantica]|uniref:Uncharacterized protein n=1 Tax=Emericellopsis atlantica TaxID=2614577 RepID=A0A9P8CRB3_9HYPO|nr:uncharacterized protein F5Z01DRAFT_651253 [Emericellopsis atlantica]KAG9256152.1 hypothetical protein F5Z01DRAFT_651253 [Emericellopsis atlantica]